MEEDYLNSPLVRTPNGWYAYELELRSRWGSPYAGPFRKKEEGEEWLLKRIEKRAKNNCGRV